jgi:hypothetical protein
MSYLHDKNVAKQRRIAPEAQQARWRAHARTARAKRIAPAAGELLRVRRDRGQREKAAAFCEGGAALLLCFCTYGAGIKSEAQFHVRTQHCSDF